MDYETFYAKIWKSGNSLVITVPESILKYGGYLEGDSLKVMTRKVHNDD